tara:strand:- start:13420 stop:13755 length:336 start_codon:yes stop_codon:yes gene_type:complete
MKPHGLHHIHQRKRKKENVHPYPSKDKWIYLLDKFLIFVAVLAPLMTLPQILRIIQEQSAAGVSLLTWILFTLFTITWILYGIVHKEKPIIISYVLWFLADLAVVILALMY